MTDDVKIKLIEVAKEWAEKANKSATFNVDPNLKTFDTVYNALSKTIDPSATDKFIHVQKHQ